MTATARHADGRHWILLVAGLLAGLCALGESRGGDVVVAERGGDDGRWHVEESQ